MHKDVQKLKYIIIPGKFPEDPEVQELHNKAYIFWRDFWNNVFKENGTDYKVKADDFWRQDMVTLLTDGNEIAGQHLYSKFNLDSIAAMEHSYFRQYLPEYFKIFRENNLKQVFSAEYLSISPNWRKKNCGISIASVFLGLACEIQKFFKSHALIGPTRTDNKVNELALELGAEIIIAKQQIYNTPVDLMTIIASNAKQHPNEQIAALISKLWNNRVDICNYNNKNIASAA